MPDESRLWVLSGARTFFDDGFLATDFFIATAFFAAGLGGAAFFLGATFFRAAFFGAVFFFAAAFFSAIFLGAGFRAEDFFGLDDGLLVFFLFAMLAQSTTFHKEGRTTLSVQAGNREDSTSHFEENA